MNNQATTQHIEHLPVLQYTLLNKFYRSHGSSMRISQPAEAWVIRDPAIIAGLCLTNISDGYWLTGLFVAPEHRQRDLAKSLLKHIQTVYSKTSIWLFCHPELVRFYQQADFQLTEQLPESLKIRLVRYQQHKKLVAMQYI